MRLSKNTTFLLLVCLFPSISFSQNVKKETPVEQYRAIHWRVEDGLTSDIHNTMIKDVEGFLWIGSADGELCRFDGAKFKKFIPDLHKRGAINSGGISSLKEDSLHNIWIGTARGLSRYDIKADTFTNFVAVTDAFNSNKSIVPFWCTSNHVYCLESGFRIVAYNVHSFEKKIVTTLDKSDIVQRAFPGIVYAIVDTVLNCLWMLEERSAHSGFGGLLQISLSNGKRQSYRWPCYRNNPNHRHSSEAMRLDRKRNSIWINSGDGLMEFSFDDMKFHETDALNEFVKLKNYRDFVGIDKDAFGRIWLATYPKGILIYDPNTERVRKLFSDPDLQQEAGYGNLHIYCDRDGIVWTSYWLQRGIYELLPLDPLVKRYAASPKMKDSLSNGFIHTIIPTADGRIWIGTDDGLNIFDPIAERFEVLREKELPGLKGNAIRPLHVDIISQKAWLNVGYMREVYETTIYEMNIKTRKCQPIIFRDRSKRFDSIRINFYLTYPYKNGLLVCDEKYGLFEIKENSRFADLVIPIRKYFRRIVVEEDRFLFLRNIDRQGSLPPNLTFENVNGKWIKIPHLLDSLEWKFIVYNNKDRSHWVSLRYELRHYDRDFRIIKTYSLEDPYNGTILNMQIDHAGNLWFINDLQQIVRLNIAAGIFTNMSEADGYQKQHFEWVSPGAKDALGNLYFGGRDLVGGRGGLDRIRPEAYSSINSAFVYFRSLTINQKPFPLDIGVNNVEGLSLSYDQNPISIETGIIDHYSKGQGYIRYKLEKNGKDEDWQYSPAYYTIRYDGLVPGKYKLVLQASNTRIEFNGPSKILMITINPAFWNTWWFRIITVISLVGLFYGLIRWRVQQKFRLRLERSQKEKELADMRHRTSELEMQALRAQMNPHFIFNSLNSINRFILKNEPEAASDYLAKFSKLIRLVLQNSGSTSVALGKELEALKLYIDMEMVRFEGHFSYQILFDDDLEVQDIEVPPLIIQPYVENAIWHGLMHKSEKGHLKIELKRNNDILICQITDDGVGRKRAEELKSKSASKSKSLGMQITAHRLELINNLNQKPTIIEVRDLLDKSGMACGTRVTLKIPV